MSARNELDKFITTEGRAKVNAFLAVCVGKDDDVDMDEVIRQNLADHEAALTGKQAEKKPARTKIPKPTVGYIAVPRGWDPRDSHDQISLWNPHASQAAAEAERAHADSLGCEPRRVVRVDTRFTVVDGGGDG